MDSPIGYLTVRTTAANQAYPVSGAKISIYCPGQPDEPCDTSITDESGQSKQFALSAPPLANSDSPDGLSAYLIYTVVADHPAYQPVRIEGVAVFPDINSSLPINLPPVLPNQPRQTITITISQTGPNGAGGANA